MATDTEIVVNDLYEQAERIVQFCVDRKDSLSDEEKQDLLNEAGSLRRKARRIDAVGVFEIFSEIRSLAPAVQAATSRLNTVSENLQTIKDILVAAAAAINLAAAISIGNAGGVISALQQAESAIEALS
ncbi:hypothetical protein ACR42D_00845 [Desulfovibrio caledoniensis]